MIEIIVGVGATLIVGLFSLFLGGKLERGKQASRSLTATQTQMERDRVALETLNRRREEGSTMSREERANDAFKK